MRRYRTGKEQRASSHGQEAGDHCCAAEHATAGGKVLKYRAGTVKAGLDTADVWT